MKKLINKYCRKLGFEVHGTGYMQSVQKNAFKEDAFQKQKELVNTNQCTIFDIGANRGNVLTQYLDLFPDANIHAFEPYSESFESLRNRFSSNKSVKCYKLAVSDSQDNRKFYVNKNVDTNSLLKPRRSGLSSDSQVRNRTIEIVPTVTIDKFCFDNTISKIDILKMDIQGGELAALHGAIELLESKKISVIYSEVFFIEQYESQPLFHHISEFLYQYGYLLQDIYSPFYGNGRLAWADAIFCIKE